MGRARHTGRERQAGRQAGGGEKDLPDGEISVPVPTEGRGKE